MSKEESKDYRDSFESEDLEIGHEENAKKKGKNLALVVGAALACLVLVMVSSACLISSLHTIDEGCVGVYFISGRLDDEASQPGVRWARPFVTRIEQVSKAFERTCQSFN